MKNLIELKDKYAEFSLSFCLTVGFQQSLPEMLWVVRGASMRMYHQTTTRNAAAPTVLHKVILDG